MVCDLLDRLLTLVKTHGQPLAPGHEGAVGVHVGGGEVRVSVFR